MFKQNFVRLCNKKGVAPTVVCQQVGLSNATFSCWTDASVPRQSTLLKIAEYFGVSVEDLLSEQPKEKEPPIQDGSKESAMSVLGELIGSLTDDEVEELRRYAEFLISKNKAKKD